MASSDSDCSENCNCSTTVGLFGNVFSLVMFEIWKYVAAVLLMRNVFGICSWNCCLLLLGDFLEKRITL